MVKWIDFMVKWIDLMWDRWMICIWEDKNINKKNIWKMLVGNVNNVTRYKIMIGIIKWCNYRG